MATAASMPNKVSSVTTENKATQKYHATHLAKIRQTKSAASNVQQ